MHLEKQDWRGVVLATGLLVAIAGIALLVGSWDLPAGVSLGRRGFTESASAGDYSLKPYAYGCFALSAALVVIYRTKRLWT